MLVHRYLICDKIRKFISGLRMCRCYQVSILDLKIKSQVNSILRSKLNESQVTIPEDSDWK